MNPYAPLATDVPIFSLNSEERQTHSFLYVVPWKTGGGNSSRPVGTLSGGDGFGNGLLGNSSGGGLSCGVKGRP